MKHTKEDYYEFYKLYAKEYYNDKFSKIIFAFIICTLLLCGPLISYVTLNNVHVYIDTRVQKCLFILENTTEGTVKKPCPIDFPESYQVILITDKNEETKKRLLKNRGFTLDPIFSENN